MKAHTITQGGKSHRSKAVAELIEDFGHPLLRQEHVERTRQMIRQFFV